MTFGNTIHYSKVIRWLIYFLVSEFLMTWFHNPDNASTLVITRLFLCVSGSLTAIILFSVFNERLIKYYIFLLTCYTLFETCLGLFQSYGIIESNHQLYGITGTFSNPNPYAGFLVISFGILSSFFIKYRKEYRLFNPVIALTLLMIIAILPSTKCRSAFCAFFVIIVFHLWNNIRYRQLIISRLWVIIPLIIVSLLLLYWWKKPSADRRWFQNKMSLLTISKNGLYGSGLGHYGDATSLSQMSYFKDKLRLQDGCVIIPDSCSNECRKAGWLPNAFCDPLQIGVEAGLVAMVTYIILTVYLLLRLYKRQSILFLGALALQIVSLFSYSISLWQNEILLILMIGEAGAYESAEDIKGAFCYMLSVISFAVLFYCCPICRKIKEDDKKWQSDRYFFDLKEFELYSIYCDSVYSSQECNDEYLMEYGFALSKTGNIQLSDSVFMQGFRVSGNPTFLLLLGDNRVTMADYDKAEEYYWNTFCCIPDRLLPLSRLADVYYRQDKNDCLESLQAFVADYHPRIESERTDSIRKAINILSK